MTRIIDQDLERDIERKRAEATKLRARAEDLEAAADKLQAERQGTMLFGFKLVLLTDKSSPDIPVPIRLPLAGPDGTFPEKCEIDLDELHERINRFWMRGWL